MCYNITYKNRIYNCQQTACGLCGNGFKACELIGGLCVTCRSK